jgi:hypothetical protein
MARYISVEKSEFINKNIEIYTQNKLGQYGKFLEKNHIFVTYYSINKQQTRADVGTGGIHAELGASSPLRFNKILNFPIYNLPELRPDLTFDETGMDIELDLTGIVILPNTVRPSPSDYLLLKIPGANEFLFRINNVEHNTIQSNDFYTVNLDIKDIGEDLEAIRLKGQIVEEYQTVYENIGTQDKCFVRTTDIDKINTLVKTIDEIKDFYMNVFYNNECNSLVLYENFPCECMNSTWLYDPYLENFVNKSNIYYVENIEKSIVFTRNDIVPNNFDYIFSRTLWYAILNRNLDYLSPYLYTFQSSIIKTLSPFKLYRYQVNSAKLYLSNKEIDIDESNPCFLSAEVDMIQTPQCWPISTNAFNSAFFCLVASSPPQSDEILSTAS